MRITHGLTHSPSLTQLLLLLTPLTTSAQKDNTHQPPNIIFILADDAGWGDFQNHDPLMVTPNLDRLRQDGVFLNQSYVLHSGVSTRAALLTGLYPHTIGLQDNAIRANRKSWLNETLTLLPKELRRLGYRTHAVGKWHLGFCHPGLTPRGRGFDTFYGFWLGSHASYWNHTTGRPGVYDWFDDDKVDWSAKGHYQTDLLSARAVRIVEESSPSQPFFLYLAYGAARGPLDVPRRYVGNYCSHVTNASRRVHCAMMAAMDQGVGEIVKTLKEKNIYNNTAILFMSDNGGPVENGAVNWPLRGGKKSLYEGGTRSYTIFKAPGLTKTNITWSGMAHAIDWFPTLVEMAGGEVPNYVHGESLWVEIRDNEPSPRISFIYNVNDFHTMKHLAIRFGKWKLLGPIPGLGENETWTPGLNRGWYPPYQLMEKGVKCQHSSEEHSASEYVLYDLEEDPTETENLYPEKLRHGTTIVHKMKDLIEEYLGKPGTAEKGQYPLQPLQTDQEEGQFSKDGHLVTCWCEPPGLADRDFCPMDV